MMVFVWVTAIHGSRVNDCGENHEYDGDREQDGGVEEDDGDDGDEDYELSVLSERARTRW